MAPNNGHLSSVHIQAESGPSPGCRVGEGARSLSCQGVGRSLEEEGAEVSSVDCGGVASSPSILTPSHRDVSKATAQLTSVLQACLAQQRK